MKRNEVTTESLKHMGYKAMVTYTSWNAHAECECNVKQSAELFALVVKTARRGGKIEIRRNLVRETVIVHIGGTSHNVKGMDVDYFLQRDMTASEILEESLRSGLWINKQ